MNGLDMDRLRKAERPWYWPFVLLRERHAIDERLGIAIIGLVWQFFIFINQLFGEITSIQFLSMLLILWNVMWLPLVIRRGSRTRRLVVLGLTYLGPFIAHLLARHLEALLYSQGSHVIA